MSTRKKVLYLLFILSLLSAQIIAQQSVDQAVITKQTDYFNAQIKKFGDQGIYSPTITTITTSQYNSQKPADAFSFDCGYVDGNGLIYVSEPTTTEQKKIFSDITEAALYYMSQSFFKFYFRVSAAPIWFITGFAAFEADLKISDDMIKEAIMNYGGVMPSFTTLNDKTNFDAKNGIAIAYLWGELMNTGYGWRKFWDINTINSETIVFDSWVKSLDEMQKVFRRYSNMRILEPTEKFRIKYQGESEHFKYYYRDNESYTMPYMQNVLEEAYTQYANVLNVQAPKKLTYSFNLECEGAKLDSVECVGRYTGGTGWMSGLVTSCAEKVEDLPLFKSLVRHELAHTFQFLIKPNFMPAWLSEGWASFLPDGIMNEQAIRNESGFANYKFEYAKEKIGHYPAIQELEDYDFVGKNNIDYYLCGLLICDFIVKTGGYSSIKSIALSDGQDFSSLGFSTKQQFENAFYNFYENVWAPKPKQISIKKTTGKPRIDGNLSEPIWENDIPLDRKFWMEGSAITVVPTIDNIVSASSLWDEENLYIAFKVKDGSLSTGNINFLNDGVEVVIDPDLSRGVDFKNSDMAFILNIGSNIPQYESSNTGASAAYLKTDDGYSIEVSIPWNKLGVTPSAGKKIGLELFNFDRDNDEYRGAYVYSGHSFQGGAALNGIAEVTLSSELAAKGIQLYSPYGDGAVIAGDNISIEFGTFNVSNVKIELSTDNEATWSLIGSDIPASSGSYSWAVPNVQTEYAKIKVSDNSDNSVYSISEKTFKIVKSKPLGPYLHDSNTILLMHFENSLSNIASPNNFGIAFNNADSYQTWINTDLNKNLVIDNTNGGSCVKVPDYSGLNLTGSWTIECWFYINKVGTSYYAYPSLLIKDGNPAAYSIYFSNDGKIITGSYAYTSGPESRVSCGSIMPKVWYHMALIRDASAKKLSMYIRNTQRQLVTSSSVNDNSGTPVNSNGMLLIGGVSGGSNIQFDGMIDELRISNIVRDFTVDVKDEKEEYLPAQFSLEQNYPNPFNPSTVISFTLPNESNVSIKIYDLLGNEVRSLLNENKNSGKYNIMWDGRDKNGNQISSGVYFYKIQAGKYSETKKMVFMK